MFGILGGTALLIYGVDMMGKGLERMSGKIMQNFLLKITGKLWKAFTSGIVLTALVQSSTAISVLSVGFVNSGILTLSQAIGIIYGANIGTTITGQFMAASLTFDLLQFSLPIIAVGFILQEFITFSNSKNIGHALMGVGFLLLGLKFLNEGIPFIENNETVILFFEKYASNLFIGILIGTVTTAIVHSSSATLAIVILLGSASLISLEAAIILMLGENIGTSVTALIVSVKGNTNARRTAVGHALHNIIGVLMAIPFIGPFSRFIAYFTLEIQGTTAITVQIANSHTIFNIVVALAFLPFHDYFVKLLEFLVKDKKVAGKYKTSFLDPLLISTPIVAFEASFRELKKAFEKQISVMQKTFKLIKEDKTISKEEISNQENKIIAFQKSLTRYMISLSKQNLTREQSIIIPGMIKCAKYLERMGNLLTHLMQVQNERNELGPCFTDEANTELNSLESTLHELAILSLHQLDSGDFSALNQAKELSQKLSNDVSAYSNRHIQRLEKDECSVEASLLYLEILSITERIGNYLEKIVSLGIYELQGISSPNPSSKPKV